MEHLDQLQRYQISAYLKIGKSYGYIAKALEERNKQFAKDLLRELIHKNRKYVWDPGDIEGLIYYASHNYCLLDTDIEQRVFERKKLMKPLILWRN